MRRPSRRAARDAPPAAPARARTARRTSRSRCGSPCHARALRPVDEQHVRARRASAAPGPRWSAAGRGPASPRSPAAARCRPARAPASAAKRCSMSAWRRRVSQKPGQTCGVAKSRRVPPGSRRRHHLQGLLHRLRAVVDAGHDVGVRVDEARHAYALSRLDDALDAAPHHGQEQAAALDRRGLRRRRARGARRRRRRRAAAPRRRAAAAALAAATARPRRSWPSRPRPRWRPPRRSPPAPPRWRPVPLRGPGVGVGVGRGGGRAGGDRRLHAPAPSRPSCAWRRPA